MWKWSARIKKLLLRIPLFPLLGFSSQLFSQTRIRGKVLAADPAAVKGT